MNSMVSAVLYVLLAPILGGLLAGFDRIVTARLEGRKGPPLLQPFYDLFKLFSKQSVVVNNVQDFFIFGFFVFIVFTGALFFFGGDLLLVFFALTLASIFLVITACSANSPYSSMGGQRELMQMMAYEPMVLIVAIALYMSNGSFAVSDIIKVSTPAILSLPLVFIGFLYILIIKLRKSPFDLSTAHHGHQEMVKGITTELSGSILAITELAHWYENVFLLGVIALFIVTNVWWSWIIAVAVCIISYSLEILIDVTCARLRWQFMLKSAWIVALAIGMVNLLILSLT